MINFSNDKKLIQIQLVLEFEFHSYNNISHEVVGKRPAWHIQTKKFLPEKFSLPKKNSYTYSNIINVSTKTLFFTPVWKNRFSNQKIFIIFTPKKITFNQKQNSYTCLKKLLLIQRKSLLYFFIRKFFLYLLTYKEFLIFLQNKILIIFNKNGFPKKNFFFLVWKTSFLKWKGFLYSRKKRDFNIFHKPYLYCFSVLLVIFSW